MSGRPLHTRLRDEAAEWDVGEDIVPLLLEAADVIEGIAGAVAHAAVIGAKYAKPRASLREQGGQSEKQEPEASGVPDARSGGET